MHCVCDVSLRVYNHSVSRSVTADFAALFGYVCLGLLFICIDGGATDNVCSLARCDDMSDMHLHDTVLI